MASEEIKEAIKEVQGKKIQIGQQLKMLDMNIEQQKRKIRYSQLVEQEMNGLPENVRTYSGVGKMFLLTSVDDLKKNIRESVSTAEETIKTHENSKEVLTKSVKEAEDNLREMLNSHRKK